MDLFGGEDANLGGIQTMGIVNAMKTGNVVIDMTIAMLIPVAIGFVFSSFTKVQKYLSNVNWTKLFFKDKSIHVRYIKHSTVTSTYSTTDLGAGDSQNEVLIKAIQLYLDHHNLLKLKTAELELKQLGDDDDKNRNNYYYYNDDSNSTTLADTLSKYKVIKKPMKNSWLKLGKYPNADPSQQQKPNKVHPENIDEFEVDLIVKENREDIENKNNNSEKIKHRHDLVLHFKSEGKESIDHFIDKAYKWYLDTLRTLEDDSRYLYELISRGNVKPSDDDDDSSGRKYKRYQLSDEKTFESLFFKEKKTVLKIVDNFTNKSGKYAIKGYPNKLGLLLHGPPGTGKTSLIKALAQKTGRSIVNVPLARISTNAELASVFFDQKYYIEGERVPVKLGFKDIIFVMEDVDAVSKVVRRRDGKTTADVTYNEQIDMPITKSTWKMLLESTDSNCKELVKMLMEKSERLKNAAKSPSLLSSAAQKMGSVPGLTMVGENTENETISKIASEAVNSASELMGKYSTVNQFLGAHAQTLKQMIEAGTEINEDFENELLGLSVSGGPLSNNSFVTLQMPSLSRNVSYKKYSGSDEVTMESSEPPSAAAAAYVMGEAMNEDGPKVEAMGMGSGTVMGPSVSSSWKAKRDELNLTGLLNVLDGVVDTPGRMLVMTTNHPEMLDPALIRPGRIDKKLLLGHLRYQDLVCMIEHYFLLEKLDEKYVKRVKAAINDPPVMKLTPAQVEQMACEFEEVDEFIDALEEKKESLTPNQSKKTNEIIYA